VEIPRLFVDDQIELCDGHSDYGYSILYCEQDGRRAELYRTRYETNRWSERTEGILSFNLEQAECVWIVTVKLVGGGKAILRSEDGRHWR
jgi:hypothetical protein